MATISLQIVAGATTITSTRTVSNANASRVMAAERINLAKETDQDTLDEMLSRAIREWIGDTRTIERNQNVFEEIQVTPSGQTPPLP